MSIKSVSNSTMSLGVITVNNTRYLAILHFRDPDGNPRHITKEMKKIADVARERLQIVVNQISIDQNFLTGRVSGQGFQFGSDVINHTTKSEEEWRKFIACLKQPTLVDEWVEERNSGDGPAVELIEEPLEGVDIKQLVDALCEKIFKAKENDEDFPALTPQEICFLQRKQTNYPNLFARKFNMVELNKLYISY